MELQPAQKSVFDAIADAPPSRRQRFAAKVEIVGSCWLWRGANNGRGYGRFHDGTPQLAHRLAWEWSRGPIPAGLVLDHLCRTPACVNPAHLEPVTQRENLLRGESVAAQNAKRTHCPRGHELSAGNLVAAALRRGDRSCKACERGRSVTRAALARARKLGVELQRELFPKAHEVTA